MTCPAGSWKVELIGTEDETPLDTTTLDGKIYFHAEPGRCFRVKVSNTERDPHLEKVSVNLKIDGDDVGYTRGIRFDKCPSVIFDGMCKKNTENVTKMYHFKFSETQLADASEIYQPAVKDNVTSAGGENGFSAGSIEVNIYGAAEVMNATYECRNIFEQRSPIREQEDRLG